MTMDPITDYKPLINCEGEKQLRRHTFIGVVYVTQHIGWRHIYACGVCGGLRVYGASAERPEGAWILNSKNLPSSATFKGETV